MRPLKQRPIARQAKNSKVDISNAPSLLPPNARTVFRDRADRFRHLAGQQQAITGYLLLMAELADNQQALVEDFANIPLSTTTGNTPLDIASMPLTPIWRQALRHIAERLGEKEGPAGIPLSRIRQATDDAMESWAAALLAGEFNRIDTGLAPFVAAALQACWTGLAARLDATQLSRRESASLCPACGAHPVASLLRSGGELHGLRYLCCSLCATQWNRPRIHCVHCGSNKDIAYYGIEGADAAVKAEACGACRSYLKIMDREKDTRVDACADDIATLGLDLLMAAEGYQRLGVNPLLLPGA